MIRSILIFVYIFAVLLIAGFAKATPGTLGADERLPHVQMDLLRHLC